MQKLASGDEKLALIGTPTALPGETNRHEVQTTHLIYVRRLLRWL